MYKIILLLFAFTLWDLGICIAQSDQHPLVSQYNPEEWAFQWLANDILTEGNQWEQWQMLWEKPLNLNTAHREDLMDLKILSPAEIQALLDHREKYAKFLSIYELQSIKGWTKETIFRILPLIRIPDQGLLASSKSNKEKLKEADQHYLAFRWAPSLQFSKGYTDSERKYIGSPHQLYTRWRFQKKELVSAGFTLEKDAGEPLQYGYASGYLELYTKWKLRKVTLGDFQLQAGQGLVFNGGFQMGKGAESILSVIQQSQGIKIYGASTESGFFRGIAATFQHKRFSWVTFASQLANDATQNDSTFNVTVTGLRRTSSEIDKAKQIQHRTIGSNLQWESKNHQSLIGQTVAYTYYNKHIQPKYSPYRLFQFTGKEHWIGSIYTTHYYGRWTVFGEIAVTNQLALGGIGGGILSLGKSTDISFLYRNYGRDFHSIYGGAFSENSLNNNEKGFYLGARFIPAKNWLINAYLDLFSFHWLKYRIDSPSTGNESLIRIQYRFSRKWRSYFQYKEEQKAKNLNEFQGVAGIAYPRKRQFTLFLENTPDKIWRFRSQLMHIRYLSNEKSTKSYLIAQDIFFKHRYFQLFFRAALFDASAYDNRLYIYENHVPYTFSFPAYYGEGFRNVAMLRVNPHKKLSLWLRYGLTTYFDRTAIGSGLDTIEGNRKHEMTVQLRLKI